MKLLFFFLLGDLFINQLSSFQHASSGMSLNIEYLANRLNRYCRVVQGLGASVRELRGFLHEQYRTHGVVEDSSVARLARLTLELDQANRMMFVLQEMLRDCMSLLPEYRRADIEAAYRAIASANENVDPQLLGFPELPN